jgi:hypothetical protein
MNVMKKRNIKTVTMIDSKYSRQTVFGGPCGFCSSASSLCVRLLAMMGLYRITIERRIERESERPARIPLVFSALRESP